MDLSFTGKTTSVIGKSIKTKNRGGSNSPVSVTAETMKETMEGKGVQGDDKSLGASEGGDDSVVMFFQELLDSVRQKSLDESMEEEIEIGKQIDSLDGIKTADDLFGSPSQKSKISTTLSRHGQSSRGAAFANGSKSPRNKPTKLAKEQESGVRTPKQNRKGFINSVSVPTFGLPFPEAGSTNTYTTFSTEDASFDSFSTSENKTQKTGNRTRNRPTTPSRKQPEANYLCTGKPNSLVKSPADSPRKIRIKVKRMESVSELSRQHAIRANDAGEEIAQSFDHQVPMEHFSSPEGRAKIKKVKLPVRSLKKSLSLHPLSKSSRNLSETSENSDNPEKLLAFPSRPKSSRNLSESWRSSDHSSLSFDHFTSSTSTESQSVALSPYAQRPKISAQKMSKEISPLQSPRRPPKSPVKSSHKGLQHSGVNKIPNTPQSVKSISRKVKKVPRTLSVPALAKGTEPQTPIRTNRTTSEISSSRKTAMFSTPPSNPSDMNEDNDPRKAFRRSLSTPKLQTKSRNFSREFFMAQRELMTPTCTRPSLKRSDEMKHLFFVHSSEDDDSVLPSTPSNPILRGKLSREGSAGSFKPQRRRTSLGGEDEDEDAYRRRRTVPLDPVISCENERDLDHAKHQDEETPEEQMGRGIDRTKSSLEPSSKGSVSKGQHLRPTEHKDKSETQARLVSRKTAPPRRPLRRADSASSFSKLKHETDPSSNKSTVAKHRVVRQQTSPISPKNMSKINNSENTNRVKKPVPRRLRRAGSVPDLSEPDQKRSIRKGRNEKHLRRTGSVPNLYEQGQKRLIQNGRRARRLSHTGSVPDLVEHDQERLMRNVRRERRFSHTGSVPDLVEHDQERLVQNGRRERRLSHTGSVPDLIEHDQERLIQNGRRERRLSHTGSVPDSFEHDQESLLRKTGNEKPRFQRGLIRSGSSSALRKMNSFTKRTQSPTKTAKSKTTRQTSPLRTVQDKLVRQLSPLRYGRMKADDHQR